MPDRLRRRRRRPSARSSGGPTQLAIGLLAKRQVAEAVRAALGRSLIPTAGRAARLVPGRVCSGLKSAAALDGGRGVEVCSWASTQVLSFSFLLVSRVRWSTRSAFQVRFRARNSG